MCGRVKYIGSNCYVEVNPVCVDAANIVASAKRKKLTASYLV